MYDRRATGLALGCALLILGEAAAAPATSRLSYRFQRIGTEAGLSQDSALTIAQDRSGFIWVGTQSGLNRYDGYEFVVHRHDAADPDSLADNWVNVIRADSGGGLWVGTRAGLQRLDPETGRLSTFRPDGSDLRVGADDVRAILDDGERGVWVGTTAGLAHLDRRSGRFRFWRPSGEDDASLRSGRVFALAVDRSGRLWVGTGGGLERLREDNRGFDHFEVGPEATGGTTTVSALYTDAAGALWIGTGNGLEVWSADGSQRRRFGAPEGLPPGQIRAITQDTAGGIWVAVYEHGIARWDPASGRFSRYRHVSGDANSLSSDLVMTVFQDRTGVLWVGGFVGGLSRTDLVGGGFDRIVRRDGDPASLSDGTVAALFGDSRGRVWIGTRTGGLNRFDREQGRVTVYRHEPRNPRSISGNFVQAFAEGPGGRIWVGSDKGLDLLDPETGLFRHVRREGPDPLVPAPAEARVLLREPGGALWVGTGSGLNRFDPETGKGDWFRPEAGNPRSLAHAGINALLRDRDGRLWIGMMGGGLARLDRLERGRAEFTHYRHERADPRSLSHDRVYCLYQDRSGVLWVGTADGLNRAQVRPNGAIVFDRRYTRTDGLPDDEIDGIAEDTLGQLWIGTGRGLARLDRTRRQIRTYTAADGIIDGTFSLGAAFAHADGTLFFGGFQGVTMFRPQDLRDNPFPPPVALTDFLVFNRSVTETSPEGFRMEGGLERVRAVTMSHRHSVFAIEFAALHYGDPLRNKYAYRLDGFDQDWVETDSSHRLATYTNLDPGRYVFRVKAASEDGVWNDEGVQLALTITPPFWKTWWFRVLAVVTLIGLLYGAYHGRVRQLAGQRDRLEKQVTERTAELQEAYRALEEVSLTDPLTGLHNRRFLMQQMEGEVAVTLRRYGAWLREGGPPPWEADLVFFLVDVDHFKAVNDAHGHAAGDRVLVQMRERLREVSRRSDHIVRWGGEEFLIVARGLPRDAAATFAERIRAAVGEPPFDIGDGVDVPLTCSVGFATFPLVPDQPRALSWEQVVGLADQALYAAKRGGRDAWVGLYAADGGLASEAYEGLSQNLAAAVRKGSVRVATRLPDATVAQVFAAAG